MGILTRNLDSLLNPETAFDAGVFDDDLAAIHRAREQIADLGPTDLSERMNRLRNRGPITGDKSDLHEIFALVGEASERLLGYRPNDNQLLTGLVLHSGGLAELPTGEGKTLAAIAPAIAHALQGHSVHILTFNDYLARRDALWMGPIYSLLGFSVACIQESMPSEQRRIAYRADIVYTTVKETGFDFLRDRISFDTAEITHRELSFAIVDEADSILIDEARTPLVLAGEYPRRRGSLDHLAQVVRDLEPGRDFDTDTYRRNVNLTEHGVSRVEKELQCSNLFANDHLDTLAEIRNALHAEVLLQRNIDYIVRDHMVELVDNLTGRVVEDRQWPDGLQAAIEAKENLDVQPEGRILGSISIQHFLRLYKKLAGMTATARGAEREFLEVYGLETTVLPPAQHCIRDDRPDLVFTHKLAKQSAVIDEIIRTHATGRPVLVGTSSIRESQELSSFLDDLGLGHEVLNALNDCEEASIIARAGDLGAITITTNMAGRGTDIKLGGPEEANAAAVRELGGLLVIGTNRHESRRIDDQLRGRAGRQGDPGASVFMISLDDPLFNRFGLRDQLPQSFIPEPRMDALDNPRISAEIEHIQRLVEGQNDDTRRSLTRYTDLIETQRASLHDWRDDLLFEGSSLTSLRSDLLERCPKHSGHHAPTEVLNRVLIQIALSTIDRCWADYLAEMARIRDGIHLVTLGRLRPFEEYHRHSRAAFDEMLNQIDQEIAAAFESTVISESGTEWPDDLQERPSATWTYLISDQPFEQGPLAIMANHQSIGAYLALLYAPLWIIWGLYCKFRGRNG